MAEFAGGACETTPVLVVCPARRYFFHNISCQRIGQSTSSSEPIISPTSKDSKLSLGPVVTTEVSTNSDTSTFLGVHSIGTIVSYTDNPSHIVIGHIEEGSLEYKETQSVAMLADMEVSDFKVAFNDNGTQFAILDSSSLFHGTRTFAHVVFNN